MTRFKTSGNVLFFEPTNSLLITENSSIIRFEKFPSNGNEVEI